MRRRRFITGGLLTGLGGGGIAAVALGHRPFSANEDDSAAYRSNSRVAYEHETFELSASRDVVRFGESIDFEVTNTGDSDATLGCNNPWAVEAYADGEWRTVTWTGESYYQMCATLLGPGSSVTESIRISKPRFGTGTDGVEFRETPTRYRFVLLGSDPYLAVDFTVRSDE